MSYIKMGDATKGRKYLEKLPDSFKKSIETLKFLTDLYIAENNYEPAAKVMEQLYLQNKDPKILEMLGTVHIKLENYPRAIELFQQLTEIFPHNQMIIKRLAGLFAKTGQVQKSYTLLNMMATSN
jgi:predicted Zn-dependent protease